LHRPVGKKGAARSSKKSEAKSLLHRGRFARASQLLHEHCRQHPEDGEAHYLLGASNGQLGRYAEAIEAFAASIRIAPRNPQSHFALGGALLALNRLDEAVESFRTAVRLEERFTDAHLALAQALLRQERLAEAEGCLRQVLRLQPDCAAALHTLGEIHHVRRDVDAALALYRRALAVNPNLAETHHRLGVALHNRGDLEEAVACFREAVRLRPQFPEAHKNLGVSLARLGRRKEAREAYRTALSHQPDYVDAVVCLADLDEQEGEYQSALARLEPFLGDDCRHPGAAMTFANLCRHFDRCDEAARLLEGIVGRGGLPPATEEQVRLALGKVHDRLGAYDSAFAHVRRANELRPSRFSPREYAGLVDALIRAFDHEFLLARPRAGHRSTRPIFVVGMPRSGTSLVEQILASHPHVFGAGELPDIGRFIGELARGGGTQPAYPRSLAGITQARVDRFADRYLKTLAALDRDAARVVDKMPQNFQHLGVIALLFPGARVVHCRRNPRDTCLSIYFQPFGDHYAYANDLEHLGLYYRQYQRLMAHWRAVLDLPLLEVDYEELVANQEAESRRLIEFAGLPWDDRCLSFHQTRRTVVTCSYDQVRQPLYSSSVGRWRHYRTHLGPLLEALEPGEGDAA
jgi:tetratricopeptide (TPR) repeat protein